MPRAIRPDDNHFFKEYNLDPFYVIPGAPDKLIRELDQEITKLSLSIRRRDFLFLLFFNGSLSRH